MAICLLTFYLMALSYGATLISFLTAPLLTPPINTIDEMIQANQKDILDMGTNSIFLSDWITNSSSTRRSVDIETRDRSEDTRTAKKSFVLRQLYQTCGGLDRRQNLALLRLGRFEGVDTEAIDK